MEVRFVGWVRVRLGVRFGVWGIGDAKEMRERNADSARIGGVLVNILSLKGERQASEEAHASRVHVVRQRQRSHS